MPPLHNTYHEYVNSLRGWQRLVRSTVSSCRSPGTSARSCRGRYRRRRPRTACHRPSIPLDRRSPREPVPADRPAFFPLQQEAECAAQALAAPGHTDAQARHAAAARSFPLRFRESLRHRAAHAGRSARNCILPRAEAPTSQRSEAMAAWFTWSRFVACHAGRRNSRSRNSGTLAALIAATRASSCVSMFDTP